MSPKATSNFLILGISAILTCKARIRERVPPPLTENDLFPDKDPKINLLMYSVFTKGHL